MNEEYVPDELPSEEASKVIAKLTEAELREIDSALLAQANHNWRKTARVVGFAMGNVSYPGVPDVFFAQRVKRLVESGKLEVQGDLSFMRFSEVRKLGD